MSALAVLVGLLAGSGIIGLAMLLRALASLERQVPQHPHGKIRQGHHGYYGFALMVLPALLLLVAVPVWLLGVAAFVQAIGGWWLVDDIRQHRIQYTRPSYLSPWHRWAHKVGLI